MGRVLVAEVDGVTVGCLRWGLFWDAIPFMNLLFVVPGRRGQGVGTALVEDWEKSQLAAGRTFVLTSTVSARRRNASTDGSGTSTPAPCSFPTSRQNSSSERAWWSRPSASHSRVRAVAW